MDIADQFKKIRVFLTKDGFIAVLKKMTITAVSAIKVDGVSC